MTDATQDQVARYTARVERVARRLYGRRPYVLIDGTGRSMPPADWKWEAPAVRAAFLNLAAEVLEASNAA